MYAFLTLDPKMEEHLFFFNSQFLQSIRSPNFIMSSTCPNPYKCGCLWQPSLALGLWVAVLTDSPSRQECIYDHAVLKSVFISRFMENAAVIPLEFPTA